MSTVPIYDPEKEGRPADASDNVWADPESHIIDAIYRWREKDLASMYGPFYTDEERQRAASVSVSLWVISHELACGMWGENLLDADQEEIARQLILRSARRGSRVVALYEMGYEEVTFCATPEEAAELRAETFGATELFRMTWDRDVAARRELEDDLRALGWDVGGAA